MATKKTKAPVPVTNKAEKKRSEILKAAGKCFRRTGFHLASMQEICTETELGPGAVYRYFASKDAIIEAMAEDERSQARAVLAGMQAGDLDAALDTMGHSLSERYKTAADAGMMCEVYAEGLRNKRVGALVRKAESDWIDGLAVLLKRGQEQGQLDATLDARHTALLLTAMWDGLVIRNAWHPEDRAAGFEAFFDTMLKKMLVRETKPRAAKSSAMPAAVPAEEAPAPVDDGRQLSLI